MSKKSNNPLALISNKLQIALRTRTRNTIEIGKLLLQAKEHLVDHGEWLPWLEKNFPLSDRTARNYMAAAEFVQRRELKLETISNLEPRLLYSLAASEHWSAEAVEAILAEARKQPVTLDRASEICAAEHAAEAAEQRADEIEADERNESEAAAILDGEPPELPPPSPSEDQRLKCGTPDCDVADFTDAVTTLCRVTTHTTAAKLVGAVPLQELMAARDLIEAVLAAVDANKAA